MRSRPRPRRSSVLFDSGPQAGTAAGLRSQLRPRSAPRPGAVPGEKAETVIRLVTGWPVEPPPFQSCSCRCRTTINTTDRLTWFTRFSKSAPSRCRAGVVGRTGKNRGLDNARLTTPHAALKSLACCVLLQGHFHCRSDRVRSLFLCPHSEHRFDEAQNLSTAQNAYRCTGPCILSAETVLRRMHPTMISRACFSPATPRG